jgi:hypothetical protein
MVFTKASEVDKVKPRKVAKVARSLRDRSWVERGDDGTDEDADGVPGVARVSLRWCG